ncbi:LacI family DNA-binding transcriptional regulator [Paenibacillus hexagrammi]|uniref:LacI family DNA-binding transcriptional regulator n=1 Tax=Paenibacillus hexagrammi TaxID=2908839 RepID=A0ABY3SD17_9BACL|nr:LacI family DNA-binding transcriptional regulator [Paenibacillus sp. YPD9-1]UJF31380.1 LacI family DNA-binding transcriptional regulator [Paenibacillus sp. YPD9-1]
MSENVTMRDIAERLGVSSVTVSKAINDKEGVSEELRKKIKDLAAEMGYRFNTLAKSMKEGLFYNIGIIIPERFTGATQAFYMQFYQILNKVLEEYDYSGILHILSVEDEEELVLPRIYREKKVDGFIILGQLNIQYMDMFLDTGVSVVLLDFYNDQPEVDCVITDSFYGVYDLTNYLIKLGHRDIAFVGDIRATSSIQDRFLGYYKSMLEHDISFPEDYVIKDRDNKGKYIDLKMPAKMPTAFVCNCDQIAYHLVTTLQKQGYSVPEDCSVVGFDNDIFATLAQPNLTTVEVNMEEMSRSAASMMMRKIKDSSSSHGRVTVKGKIIYRDSVRDLRNI